MTNVKRVFWREPPEGYERQFKGIDYVRILGDKIKGTDFLDGFIQDLCQKDMKFKMSEKQEKWLKKVEWTFLKDLKAAGPSDGLDFTPDSPSEDEIPF